MSRAPVRAPRYRPRAIADRTFKSAEVLAGELDALVRSISDDRELLAKLEALSSEPAFDGLAYRWGPTLYRRNRVVFRSFILSHLSQWSFDGKRWKRIRWPEHGRDLADWERNAREAGDARMVRELLGWRFAAERGWGLDSKALVKELVSRYREAPTAAARAIVLDTYGLWFSLDEDESLELYRIGGSASGRFILQRIPYPWRTGERKLWQKLFDQARERGDDELAFSLYRKQIPTKQWEKDVDRLCATELDADRLQRALEARHPEGFGLDLGAAFHRLVDEHGATPLPYIKAHLRNVWSHWYRSGYDRMVALAVQRGWFDLWAALIRTCAKSDEFSAEVDKLLGDKVLARDQRYRRLAMLAGVSREINFAGFGLAQVHSLKEATALRLYQEFPQLVRGPYKPHVAPTWGASYPVLTERLIDAGDDDLVDFIASRIVTRAVGSYSDGKWSEQIEPLSRYYEGIRERDALEFARRAASVLTRVPAFAIYDYRQLVRTNRLARLLFARSESTYLACPEAVADLVEGSEIHVQDLAYRILAQDDDRARELAAHHFDILQGTLFRPLHRKTRLHAFAALVGAAAREDTARRVLARARDALALPDLRYPKEELVGLIGAVLHRHPSLRSDSERPVVFGYRKGAA